MVSLRVVRSLNPSKQNFREGLPQVFDNNQVERGQMHTVKYVAEALTKVLGAPWGVALHWAVGRGVKQPGCDHRLWCLSGKFISAVADFQRKTAPTLPLCIPWPIREMW